MWGETQRSGRIYATVGWHLEDGKVFLQLKANLECGNNDIVQGERKTYVRYTCKSVCLKIRSSKKEWKSKFWRKRDQNPWTSGKRHYGKVCEEGCNVVNTKAWKTKFVMPYRIPLCHYQWGAQIRVRPSSVQRHKSTSRRSQPTWAEWHICEG